MEFVTGALGTLLPKLGQLLKDEYNLQKGTKKNIEFLSRELESIKGVLCSVGEVQPEQLKEHVKIWARDVRELSYDMEDIVDTFLVRVQSPEAPSKKSAKRFVKKMMGIVTKAITQHEIAQEIKDIKERVKEIAERRDRYKVDAINRYKVDAITPTKTLVDPRITSLYTEAANLVGFNDSKKELVTRLTKGAGPSTQKKVVSVVGFGGLGKTTLAKAVYDKLKVQFDCIAFVPVGRNPDLKKVFKDILIDLHSQKTKEDMLSLENKEDIDLYKQRFMLFDLDMLDERQLIDKLREFLETKRYFIVVDDVWEAQTWETIKLALVEKNKGSRIIITTRKHEIAKEAGEVYELQPLSDANSRKLFFARIFGAESKSSDHQPNDVSDKILRKCGGIPLAIITMASLLEGKPREEWSQVHRSIGYTSKGNRQVENTMKIISFSYYDLPPHLRTCLLYLSVFPEDSFIEKGALIWMWIAEGFIQEEQGICSFEIGEGYFNELVNRSLIELVEKWELYEMVVCGCQVHDMVLDLIRSISFEENFVTRLTGKNNEGASSSLPSVTQGRVRRLALQNSNRAVEANMDMEKVRTFVSCGKGVIQFVSSLSLVRVVSIHTSVMMNLSLEPLHKLLHLRYLQLSTEVMVPREIGTLRFLQTLDVHGPLTSVGSLTELLCLRIRGTFCRVPDGIGNLTSLQELQIVLYNGEGEEPPRRFAKELGSLRELRVLRLGMRRSQLPYGSGMLKAMMASLCNLQRLEHLLISDHGSGNPVSVNTETLEAWGFLLPRTLRQLFLDWTRFFRVPLFFINPSRHSYLSHLYLFVDYLDEQDMRVLGGLPELRYLRLHALSTTEVVCRNTTNAAGDHCFFPKLRWCRLEYRKLQFQAKGSSDAVSFCMRYVDASMLLGSDRRDVVWSDKGGVAPTLMPSIQKLQFYVPLQQLVKDGDCGSSVLQYFASLQNVTVCITGEDGFAAPHAEESAAALRHAADVHPNRPTLEIKSYLSREP